MTLSERLDRLAPQQRAALLYVLRNPGASTTEIRAAGAIGSQSNVLRLNGLYTKGLVRRVAGANRAEATRWWPDPSLLRLLEEEEA